MRNQRWDMHIPLCGFASKRQIGMRQHEGSVLRSYESKTHSNPSPSVRVAMSLGAAHYFLYPACLAQGPAACTSPSRAGCLQVPPVVLMQVIWAAFPIADVFGVCWLFVGRLVSHRPYYHVGLGTTLYYQGSSTDIISERVKIGSKQTGGLFAR